MFDPLDRSQMDQALASIRDTLPGLWRALFEGCVEKGFSEAQAMRLVVTYILSQGNGPTPQP